MGVARQRRFHGKAPLVTLNAVRWPVLTPTLTTSPAQSAPRASPVNSPPAPQQPPARQSSRQMSGDPLLSRHTTAKPPVALPAALQPVQSLRRFPPNA